jgi:inosine-uridine nucleoside N-ribohydrolase
MATSARVIIDCDPGIGPGLDADDGLAILLALASPELRVEAVTTVFGNVSAIRAADNALRIVEAAGRSDIPVARGMGTPLRGELSREASEEYAAQDGRLVPVREEHVTRSSSRQHAVDLLIEQVLQAPGELSILAIGPLTNVAMAILKEPAFRTAVRRIVMMGGAFGHDPQFGRGNVTPVAELNMWNDPLAADIVFRSGIPITAVGLDITNPNAGTVLYEDQLRGLLAGRPSGLQTFLGEMCGTYIKAPRFDWAQGGCVLYDAVAAAVLAQPGLADTLTAAVRVSVSDPLTAGQTVASPSPGGNVRVSTGIDGPAFVGLFLERITRLLDEAAAAGA